MSRPGVRLAGLAALWIVGGCCMVGCNLPEQSPRTSEASASSTAIVLDTGRPLDVRIDAARSVDLRSKQAWSALSRVGWSMRESSRLRVAALSAMVAADATRFWEEAATHWPSERSDAVEKYLLGTASDAGELAAAALLQRWAVTSEPGPLRDDYVSAWNAALNLSSPTSQPSAARDAMMTWLVGDRPWAQRIAAWRVVSDAVDRRALADILQRQVNLSGGERAVSPLVADLAASSRMLNEWPTRGWELCKLRSLRAEKSEFGISAWSELESVMVDWPNGRRRHGGAIRHAAWILSRPMDAQSAYRETDGSINPWDAAVARWLGEALRDVDLRRTLFDQADADHADSQSEHGGLVKFDDAGSPAFARYAPAERRHDRAYIAPPTLSFDLGDAAATYHFHAEKHHNPEHAGPGSGDRRAVEQSRMSMLVLTFLDRNTLAVHFAAPDDQLFDLGTIQRP